MTISPDLRAYLADWLAWTERGAPNEDPYSRAVGLCANSASFLGIADVCAELCGVLEEEFDDSICPFGADEYIRSQRDRTQHLDPKRLAWVRAMLEQ